MCKRGPCIGTLDDIEKIVNAGYIHLLAPTIYAGYYELGIAPTKLIAPLLTPTGCAFLDKNGGCILHAQGLKPTEGRCAHHANSQPQSIALNLEIRKTWI
jgi:hypothetical protein